MKQPLKTVLIIITVSIGIVIVAEAAALVFLKRSVGTYKNYWHKNNAQTVGANEILYVALGDSTAQGIGASQPAKGYVGLLADALAKKYEQPVKIYNVSVSGATVQDVERNQLPLLKQTATTQKTIITLAIGANDMRTFDAAVFTQHMQAVLQVLPKQTIVADIAYFGGGRYRHLEDNVVAANKIIHELAAQHGLTVAPLHAVTEQQQSILVNAADLFHPSDIGYRNWRDAFKRALEL